MAGPLRVEQASSALREKQLYALSTRPNDLDSLGHVNHAVVLEYLEAARWDLAQKLGLRARSRFAVVVSRIEIDYLAQVHAGQIAIETRFNDLPEDFRDDLNYKVVLRQSVHAEAGAAPLVRAEVTLAFLDLESGAPCALQDCLESAGSGAPR